MAQLINTATANGVYDTMPVTDTTQAVVELDAISIEKSADKPVWVNGNLEYTITVTNLDTRPPDDPTDPGLPVTNLVITDNIDLDIANLDETSLVVTVNGQVVTDPDYEFVDGLLTVTIPSLPATQTAVITFQVTQAP